jgi:hypothetical protein
MTYFETLNPTIEACSSFGHVMSLKMKVTSLGLEHLLRSLLKHLSLESLSLFRILSIPPVTCEDPLA